MLKTNEAILLQISTNGLCGTGDETLNFGGQEVKAQGHTTPKSDLEAWWRHHSRPLGSSRFSNYYNC